MEEVRKIIQRFEEYCETLAITHDSPSKDDIEDIFEEYHQAKLKLLGIGGVVSSFKPLTEVSIGDYVKCKTIHQRSTKGLTIGRNYKVYDVYDTGYKGFIFYIIDDNGKKRRYFDKNSQFEISVD